jgi:hypothetical protein
MTSSGSKNIPLFANKAYWEHVKREEQRQGLAERWCSNGSYAPQLPGGRTIEQILLLLSEAKSTEKVQGIIADHAFYHHVTEQKHFPTVTLRNGFLYTLPFQHCGIYKCSVRGLCVREWETWNKAYGWSIPMSIEALPKTLLSRSPSSEELFGPPF